MLVLEIGASQEIECSTELDGSFPKTIYALQIILINLFHALITMVPLLTACLTIEQRRDLPKVYACVSFGSQNKRPLFT